MGLIIGVSTSQWMDGRQMAMVGLDGALDTATGPQLEKALLELFEGPTQILVFDLEKLSFISSGGLRVILTARKKILERNGRCVMLRTQPRIHKIFEIIEGLGGLMFFKEDEELDAFLATLQKPSAA